MRKRLPFVILCASSVASANPPEADAPTAASQALVQRKLLEPLAVKEQKRSRFSRAAPPAVSRRVRVLDVAARRDGKGGEFVGFAVDSRSGYFSDDDENIDGEAWREGVITGCVYPGRGEVYVQKGSVVYPAAILLGKRARAAAAHVCHGETAAPATGLAANAPSTPVAASGRSD